MEMKKLHGNHEQRAYKMQAKLPNKKEADYQDKFKEMILFMNKSFRDNSQFWEHVHKSLEHTLKQIS